MKPCAYCGRKNEDADLHCVECGSEFQSRATIDTTLIDPAGALVTIAECRDLIHATLLRDELESAGIGACVPEELSASPFDSLMAFAHFTVQVAARDCDAAKEIFARQA
mgnify:FL=1